MKDRYIRKKDGSLRMRCKTILSSFLVMATVLMGTQTYSQLNVKTQNLQYMEQIASHVDDSQLLAYAKPTLKSTSHLLSPAVEEKQENIDADQSNFLHHYSLIKDALLTDSEMRNKLVSQSLEITVKKGDTLEGILQKNGIGRTESFTVVKAMSDHLDPRLLRPGQNIKLTMLPHNGVMTFSRLDIVSDPIRTIIVERNADGDIVSQVHQKEIVPQMFAAKATIKNSLYGSAMEQGMPESIIAQAIRVLSWSVDFQREIRAGDELQVLYNVYMTDEGDYVRSGEPYYISLIQSDQEIALYLHEFSDGHTGYFRKNGHSAKKGLLRTLVDGARISSTYGMRKHPVLGYSKMHKGIDFAAARGTPVYAAGDGVVERASRFSSYGNYVKIRHNNNLKTAYAHLNKYAKGIKAGSRVKQGQVIGYVGSTGRVTGAHLHYEVLENGKQVNPRSVKVPTGEVLIGRSLQALKDNIRKYDRQFSSLIEHKKFASNRKPSHSKILN